MSQPVKEGWLTKRGGVRKNWKRRWFALRPAEQTLCYYKGLGEQEAHGSINIRDCVSCSKAEEQTQKENSFLLNAGERTYFFVCDTKEERTEWVQVLSKAIVMRQDITSATSNLARQSEAAPKNTLDPSPQLAGAAAQTGFQDPRDGSVLPEDLADFSDI